MIIIVGWHDHSQVEINEYSSSLFERAESKVSISKRSVEGCSRSSNRQDACSRNSEDGFHSHCPVVVVFVSCRWYIHNHHHIKQHLITIFVFVHAVYADLFNNCIRDYTVESESSDKSRLSDQLSALKSQFKKQSISAGFVLRNTILRKTLISLAVNSSISNENQLLSFVYNVLAALLLFNGTPAVSHDC
jgi:hypothetical protein